MSNFNNNKNIFYIITLGGIILTRKNKNKKYAKFNKS